MTILDFSKEQIKKLVDAGLMNKKNLVHYDICKDIQAGVPMAQVQEKYGYFESKSIRWIKQHKCKDCR